MRNLKLVTIASIILYNLLVLPSINLNSSPALSSYIYGLLIFICPFLPLFAAAKAGLNQRLVNLCIGVGVLGLIFVVYLIAIDQALFVAPAILIAIGIFSSTVLLLTLAIFGINILLRNTEQANPTIEQDD